MEADRLGKLIPPGTFSNRNSSVGNFSDMPDLSSFGLGCYVSNLYTSGVVTVAVVPEPSRVLLMLIGLLALGFRRRIQD
jgi:hypothetical protein